MLASGDAMGSLRARKGIPILVVALAAALGVVAGLAPGLVDRRESGASTSLPLAVKQRASAIDAGLEVRAIEASFSGTSTYVRLEVRGQGIGQRAPVPLAWEGPFGAALWAPERRDPQDAFAAFPQPDGTVVVRLGPLDAPPGYDGVVDLTFSRWLLPDGRTVEGEWTLALQGPRPDELPEALAFELLRQVETEEDPYVGLVAVRSRAETLLVLAPVADASIVQPPTVVSGGERLAPLRFELLPDLREKPDPYIRSSRRFLATYPPTPLGSEIVAEGVVVAVPLAEDSMVLRVDLGAALASAGPGQRDFSIPPELVPVGDKRKIVRGIVTDRPDGMVQVGIELRGAWDPTIAPPRVYDDAGREVELAGVQVFSSKDAAGNVSAGTTVISVFADSREEVGSLTFVLGPESEVVTLPPVPLRILLTGSVVSADAEGER